MNQSSFIAQQRLAAIRVWMLANGDVLNARNRPQPFRALVDDFLAGVPVDELAATHGRTRNQVIGSLREYARRLGFVDELQRAWLLPDGQLNPASFADRPETGCLLWLGVEPASDIGPISYLPTDYARVTHRDRRHVALRRFLYERTHGPIDPGLMIVTLCGNRRCIAADHWRPVRERSRRPPDMLASIADRAGTETVPEAMARTGLTRTQVVYYRPPGGKRQTNPSALRDALTASLPADPPPTVMERDWQCARRFVAGETVAAIAADLGVTRQMVHFRLKRTVARLETTT